MADRDVFHRLLAVLASVLIVGCATEVAGRGATSIAETAATTSDARTGSATTSDATTTSVPQARDCGTPSFANYDFVGTMHTILENVQPLRVTIEPVEAPWCTGGSGRVRFTITNDGTDDETLDAFRIILNGGMAKYPLLPSNSAAARTPVALAPAETRSWDLAVVIPAVPPGQYPLQLYGFSESAMVEILGPRACATDDLAAVAGPTDSAMGHSSTAITVTNVGDDACFIGTPLWAQGTAAGGSTPQLTVDFGAPSYFPTTDPRPSRTLLPGERTITILATSAACVDTVVPTYWTHLQLVLDWSRHAVLDIDLGAGSAVQTDCGGAFSGWSVAPR